MILAVRFVRTVFWVASKVVMFAGCLVLWPLETVLERYLSWRNKEIY